MSDRIVVIHEGEIQQLGSPRQIYNNPNNLFVADFIGDRNIKKVEIVGKDDKHVTVKLGSNTIKTRYSKNLDYTDDTAILAIHMDKMRIACDEVPNSIPGEILSIHYAGSQVRTQINVDGEKITVIQYQNNDCDYDVGNVVYITWEDSGALVLPMEDFKESGIST